VSNPTPKRPHKPRLRIADADRPAVLDLRGCPKAGELSNRRPGHAERMRALCRRAAKGEPLFPKER